MGREQLQGIVARQSLSEEEMGELRKLAELVDREAGITVKLNWTMLTSRKSSATNDYCYYADGKLVGFLGLYIFQDSEAEVSGLVHPDYRRRGIFTRLVRDAAADVAARNIPRLLFICQRNSQAGQAFQRSLGSRYSFSEYVMQRDADRAEEAASGDGADGGGSGGAGVRLEEACQADVPLLTKMNQLGFELPEKDAEEYSGEVLGKPDDVTYLGVLDGQAVGKLSVQYQPAHSFIYGFTVLPEFQGKGIGRAILEQTVQHIQRRQGKKPIRLEVALENSGALKLYQSCGFREQNINDYFAYGLTTR